MEDGCNCFFKVISIFSLLICALIIVYINFLPIKDYEFDDKFDNFVIFLALYIYLVPRICLNIIFLMAGFKPNWCTTSSFTIVFLSLAIYFIYFLSIHKIKSTANKIKLVLTIISFVIDILTAIPLCQFNSYMDESERYSFDCLEIYFKNKQEKIDEETKNKISELKRENNYLIEENKKLLSSTNKNSSLNVEDKKIEVILSYIKNKYKKTFDSNILYKYLQDEIKNNYGENIDKNKFKKIFLIYIKDKFAESLTCPLTADTFLNPVITPEGQTFDKNYLLKEIRLKGQNPLTRNKLDENEIIENKVVLDLCEILKYSEDNFNMENFLEMKKLLINPETKTLYTNPYVIKGGIRKGETAEGKGTITEYFNRIIFDIIEQNRELLMDDFLEEMNNSRNKKNIGNNEDTINTDTRLNINIKY